MSSTETTQPQQVGGFALTNLLGQLFDAWDEMQKFGRHEGDCNFSRFCEECGTPLDRCDLHSEKMHVRTEKMKTAINQLKAVTNDHRRILDDMPNAKLTGREIEKIKAERDEWARKWHKMRRELAELKYPLMNAEVHALDA